MTETEISITDMKKSKKPWCPPEWCKLTKEEKMIVEEFSVVFKKHRKMGLHRLAQLIMIAFEKV